MITLLGAIVIGQLSGEFVLAWGRRSPGLDASQEFPRTELPFFIQRMRGPLVVPLLCLFIPSIFFPFRFDFLYHPSTTVWSGPTAVITFAFACHYFSATLEGNLLRARHRASKSKLNFHKTSTLSGPHAAKRKRKNHPVPSVVKRSSIWTGTRKQEKGKTSDKLTSPFRTKHLKTGCDC